jgi:hypothetical protein
MLASLGIAASAACAGGCMPAASRGAGCELPASSVECAGAAGIIGCIATGGCVEVGVCAGAELVPGTIGIPVSLELAAFVVVHGMPNAGPHAAACGSGAESN